MITLKLNDLNLNVVRIQLRLSLFPTGYFDDRTLKAVMAFQKANRLKPDGVVGPKTWTALDLGPLSAATSEPLRPLTSWMNVALAEKGKGIEQNPKPGQHHPRILEYHRSTTLAATTDEVAWCSSFVNFVMEASGRPGTGGADAKSWLTWKGGTVVKEPKYGDIVVTKLKTHPPQNSGYHVAFFISATATHVTLLGGNQERSVRESSYPKEKYESIVYIRPRSSGTSIFMKLGDIQGNVTAEGYAGWMEVATFDFGVERRISMAAGHLANRESGRPNVSRIAITKLADNSVAALFKESLSGVSGRDATIAFVHTGNKPQESLRYKLRDCLISHYAMAAHADQAPVEGLMLSYSAIETTFRQRDAAGRPGTPMRVGYNVREARVV